VVGATYAALEGLALVVVCQAKAMATSSAAIPHPLSATVTSRYAELRRRVTVGLNKGEAKNALARAIFFNRRGIVQDRTFEDQQNRASGLNLVVAAIIVWNTFALEHAVETMHAQGVAIPEEHLQHLAPLAWEHIILTGEYVWDLQQAVGLKKGRMFQEVTN